MVEFSARPNPPIAAGAGAGPEEDEQARLKAIERRRRGRAE